MTIPADEHFPATFTLDSGSVTSVQTSAVDPRVIFDKLGIRATDGSGAVLASLNANGSGTFKGRIAAGGLDLVADDAATFDDPVNKIRWHLVDENGNVIAEMIAYEAGGHDHLRIRTLAQGADPAELWTQVLSGNGLKTGIISMQAQNGQNTNISVLADAVSKSLLKGDGSSDWVMDSTWILVGAGGFSNGVTNFGSGYQPIGWKALGRNLWLVQGLASFPGPLATGQAAFGSGPGLANRIMVHARYQDGTNSLFEVAPSSGVMTAIGAKAAGWYWFSSLLAGP